MPQFIAESGIIRKFEVTTNQFTMTNLQQSTEEIWKPIPDFENLYLVSNLGVIKSLPIISATYRNNNEIIRKPGIVCGYACISLCKNRKNYQFKVHRIVGKVFVDGYFDGAIINHKDGNKLNNAYWNLEWCDTRHNVNHAFKMGLRKGKKFGESHYSKKVVNIETGETFDSVRRISILENIPIGAVSLCMNGHITRHVSQHRRDRLSKYKFA